MREPRFYAHEIRRDLDLADPAAWLERHGFGTLAAEHHRPQAGVVQQPAPGLEQGLEHAVIEAVVLVGPHQADLGDALGSFDAYAIVHGRVGSTPPRGREG